MRDDTKTQIDLDAIGEHQGGATPESGFLGSWVDKGGYVFAVGILAAAIILLTEIFLRYVFNSPTSWAHEMTTFLCGIAFVYGGLYCASRNSHIRVVLIYDKLSDRWRRIMEIFISLACSVASMFFVYAAWIMAKKALFAPGGDFRLERSGSAWDPPTPALLKVFLLVILTLLALQYLILAINHIKRFKKGADQ